VYATVNKEVLLTISGLIVQIKHPLMMLQLIVLVTAGYSDTFWSLQLSYLGTHFSSHFVSRCVCNPVEQMIVSLCWYWFMSTTCVNWTCAGQTHALSVLSQNKIVRKGWGEQQWTRRRE
jgi:hypothetical protein